VSFTLLFWLLLEKTERSVMFFSFKETVPDSV